MLLYYKNNGDNIKNAYAILIIISKQNLDHLINMPKYTLCD